MFLRPDRIFNLERLPWVGFGVLTVAILPTPFFLHPTAPPNCAISSAPTKIKGEKLDLNLPLRSDFAAISIEGAESQISFSVDPPRPSAETSASRLMVRLTQAKQTKRIEVPTKLDLEFGESGILNFTSKPSQFWLEIDAENQARLVFSDPSGVVKEVSRWTIVPQETPIQMAEEFSANAPFRQLAEARWSGQDLFALHYGDGTIVQRLEIGSPAQSVVVSANGWLVYQDGRWRSANAVLANGSDPISRVRTSSSKGLELEGWDGASHIRLLLPQSPLAPLKAKGEELFTQLRVRSEKQISCTLDKQCLILRPGDWVLKMDQRWKLLRKKEEKEAFLNGAVSGDLFVLDRIEAKGAVKSISGHYFNPSRSQMAAIDYAVPPSRTAHSGKSRELSIPKAKGKAR